MSDALDCPVCNSSKLTVEYLSFTDEHRVVCHGCGISGPASTSRRYSIELWNDLPRKDRRILQYDKSPYFCDGGVSVSPMPMRPYFYDGLQKQITTGNQPEDQKTCSHCNTPNPQQNIFCLACGAIL